MLGYNIDSTLIVDFHREALLILGLGETNGASVRALESRLEDLVLFVGAGLSAEFGLPTWSELLQRVATQHGRGQPVSVLLSQGKFEEAAEAIEDAVPGALAGAIREVFDPSRLREPQHTPAVDRIPRLGRRFVLTTNFDTVLEAAFDRAGKPFEAVYQGTQILQATAAVHDSRHVLLKLHGTYNREAERVLTRSEYETHYRQPDPAGLRKPKVPNVLRMALGKQPVLFVGCSLQTDRTMAVLQQVVEDWPGVSYFGLLPESERVRESELRDLHIHPLFFRHGDYAPVGQFLDLLARYLEQRPSQSIAEPPAPLPPKPRDPPRQPRWGRWLAVAALLLLLAGAAFISRWGHRGDPYDTPAAEAAAARAFHAAALAAGYLGSEVIESWRADFLQEHWIPGPTLVGVLERKRQAGEPGDFAVGIWHDRTNDDSMWTVAASLANRRGRPSGPGSSFTLDSRGIEPAAGPHRASSGGLSAVGRMVVLDSYAGAFAPPLVQWICDVFTPTGPPYIEVMPSNDDLEAVRIAGGAGCPEIGFLAVKDRRQPTPVERFRTRLGLQALAAGRPADDTVYVSVSKSSGNQPRPIRVSLLWLTRAAEPVDAHRAALEGSTPAARDRPRLGAPVTLRKDAWWLPDEPLLGFVAIAGGEYTLGARKTVNGNAEPPRKGSIEPYYLGRYEVTTAQYRAFVEATSRRNASQPLAGADLEPVTWVSWMDAVEYADWLDHAVRQNPSASPALSAILTARDCVVTLPGDAEWERGARGSGGRIYPWGDQPIDATRANYSGAIKPIGSYLNGRSEDGLFDMVGNVWEWTRTLMEPGPAPPLGFPYRPQDLAREHPRGSEYRVVRGGSFGNDLSQPTNASSTGYDPDGNKAIGFRLGISCNSQ